MENAQISLPFFILHNRIEASLPPDTTISLSGEIATHHTYNIEKNLNKCFKTIKNYSLISLHKSIISAAVIHLYEIHIVLEDAEPKRQRGVSKTKKKNHVKRIKI